AAVALLPVLQALAQNVLGRPLRHCLPPMPGALTKPSRPVLAAPNRCYSGTTRTHDSRPLDLEPQSSLVQRRALSQRAGRALLRGFGVAPLLCPAILRLQHSAQPARPGAILRLVVHRLQRPAQSPSSGAVRVPVAPCRRLLVLLQQAPQRLQR